MYELIVMTVVAISTLIAKAVKKAKQQRQQEELTSQAYEEEGNSIAAAGWNTIEQGFKTGNTLATAGIIEVAARRADARKRKIDEAEFNEIVMILGLGIAAILIIAMIFKSKTAK